MCKWNEKKNLELVEDYIKAENRVEELEAMVKKIGLELAANYLEKVNTYVYPDTMKKFADDIRKL